MLVRGSPYVGKSTHLNISTGEDNMTSEKSKEEHYTAAAQHLNTGERAAAEAGEGVSGTLAFLTRGEHYNL